MGLPFFSPYMGVHLEFFSHEWRLRLCAISYVVPYDKFVPKFVETRMFVIMPNDKQKCIDSIIRVLVGTEIGYVIAYNISTLAKF